MTKFEYRWGEDKSERRPAVAPDATLTSAERRGRVAQMGGENIVRHADGTTERLGTGRRVTEARTPCEGDGALDVAKARLFLLGGDVRS